MDAHQAYLKHLKLAVKEGGALIEIVQSEKAHILSCPICQKNFARFDEDYYTDLLSSREESGQYEPMARHINFDLSFLNMIGLNIWSVNLEMINDSILVPGIDLVAKLFSKPLKVIIENKATLDLSPFLSQVATGLTAVRSVEPGSGNGQRVTLPDLTLNFRVDLIILPVETGLSHLRVEVKEDNLPAGKTQVRLKSTHGGQMSYTHAGVIEFDNLKPDVYTIEIKPDEGKNAGHTWRLDLTIEPATLN